MAGNKRGDKPGSHGGRHGSTRDSRRPSATSETDAQVSENLMPLGHGMSTVTLEQSAPPHSNEPTIAPAAEASGMPSEAAPPLTRGMLARDGSQSRRNDHDRDEDTADDAINAQKSNSEGSDEDEDNVSVATEASGTSVFTPRSQLPRSGIEHPIAIPSPAVIPYNPSIKDLMLIIVSNHAETSAILRNIGDIGYIEKHWHTTISRTAWK